MNKKATSPPFPDWMFACICCPVTREDLSLARQSLVERLLAELEQGALVCTLGVQVAEEFEGGLVNQTESYFYPIRNGIPCLVPAEAIAIR